MVLAAMIFGVYLSGKKAARTEVAKALRNL
jgi:hypothetical protein